MEQPPGRRGAYSAVRVALNQGEGGAREYGATSLLRVMGCILGLPRGTRKVVTIVGQVKTLAGIVGLLTRITVQ